MTGTIPAGAPPARLAASALLLLLFASGCGQPAGRPAAKPAPANAAPGTPRLVDVTQAAGLRWTHNPCRSGKKYLPETMGGGGGFLDVDRDGWLDIVLINGAPLPGYSGPTPGHALYRNNRDGTFSEVAGAGGLVTREYGMGAAAGDFDGDGWTDLYVTSVGKDRLYRNERGRLVDVTTKAGVADPRWSTGAAWLDYDRDGDLDLFVANYVDWSPGTDLPCGSEKARQYCPPYQYRGAAPTLYRNRGDGTFEDVSAEAGVLGHSTKTLSSTPCDANGDGWVDLFLANDTEPDVLLINHRDGTFEDQSLSAGVAVGTDGRATGSMGVDTGAPFNDDRTAIAVGNFVGQGMSLFTQLTVSSGTDLLFENRKHEAGLADPTLPMSTFGLLFSDVDRDGWLDLIALNGNLDENLALERAAEPYRQLPQLLQNRQDGTFQDAAAAAGLSTPMVGRALAVGDYDNDGRQDFLAIENGGPVRLWHNETPPAGEWLGIELTGGKGPAEGATVTLHGSGWKQHHFVSTTRSYLACNDPRVHFGLGKRAAERVEVRWPSGKITEIRAPKSGSYLPIKE